MQPSGALIARGSAIEAQPGSVSQCVMIVRHMAVGGGGAAVVGGGAVVGPGGVPPHALG